MSTTYAGPDEAALEKRVVSKVFVRLLPFLGLMFVLNQLDRSNVGFAAPNGLSEDLGLTQAMFGLAAGLFFIGYVVFEVPSNLALHRFGARKWLARIMITWGLVTVATAFVQTTTQFYVIRVLLGVAEAGFTPGALLFICLWIPRAYRARAIAYFGLAIPVAAALGGVMAGYLIQYGDGLLGLPGWRFMILAEGVPAVVVGIACWFYLTDKPSDAKWLTPKERNWLSDTMHAEQLQTQGEHKHTMRSALLSTSTLALMAIYILMQYGNQAVGFFLPTIVAGFSEQFATSFSILQQGAIVGVPFVFAGIAMAVNGWHSDRTGERTLHLAIPLIVGGCAIPFALYQTSPLMVMVFVTVGLSGFLAAIPVLWTFPSRYMQGATAAAGIAVINSFGNLGGFGGPYVTGWIIDGTGSTKPAMWLAGGALAAAGVVALAFGRRSERGRAKSQPRESPARLTSDSQPAAR